MIKQKILGWAKFITIALILVATFAITPKANADDAYTGPMVGFMMSPMTKRVELNPGDTITSSFYISNPEQNTASVAYTIKVKSFYRDEESNAIFEDVDGRGQIANWITLDSPDSGTLAPNASEEINYTINVPTDAPSGGQYAAIVATSAPPEGGLPDSAILKETIAMAHTIFAEVKGETRRSAIIMDPELPSFLADGDIFAISKVTNTGNVHGTASYTLEVYPLFSNEPIYSNEDNPDKKLILPNRSIVHRLSWEGTPSIGIFNVRYKVEFEGGETKELNKLVIKCPIWLVLVVTSVIIIGSIFIFYKIKKAHRVSSV